MEPSTETRLHSVDRNCDRKPKASAPSILFVQAEPDSELLILVAKPTTFARSQFRWRTWDLIGLASRYTRFYRLAKSNSGLDLQISSNGFDASRPKIEDRTT